MNSKEYQKVVKGLKIGKHLADAIYLHKETLEDVPFVLFQFLHKSIAILELEKAQWDLVKFSKKEFKLSLLSYPTFFSDSYPTLQRSYTLNFDKYSYRKANYSNSENPPILHRKETFLLSSHPAVPEFIKITQEGERAGLYENSRTIGFKKAWLELIAQKGFSLVAGRLVANVKTVSQDDVSEEPQSSKPAAQKIERHKTTIDRNSLSAPMQSLFRHDYLKGNYSLFDYGCGKGDDLNILANHNVTAHGWDPVYCPDNTIQKSDIVNLGFVINVIEDQKERRETLQKAYQLTNKILVVSVMLGGESTTSKFEKYGDGVVTSRKTFQKYYGQTEFREYLQRSLKETALAVGPGVFYIFKDKLEEQQFLVERQRVKRNWPKLSYIDHPERLKVKQRALYERHKDLFNDFWCQCLDFGRLPANNEFTQSEELRSLCSSHQKYFL